MGVTRSQNRTGKITRGALRKVIESFKFRITDAQFNELIHYLDPDASNSISYKKFLAIFEAREELEVASCAFCSALLLRSTSRTLLTYVHLPMCRLDTSGSSRYIVSTTSPRRSTWPGRRYASLSTSTLHDTLAPICTSDAALPIRFDSIRFTVLRIYEERR